MPSSMESSRPGDRTRISCVFCIGRWVLDHQCCLGSRSPRLGLWMRPVSAQRGAITSRTVRRPAWFLSENSEYSVPDSKVLPSSDSLFFCPVHEKYCPRNPSGFLFMKSEFLLPGANKKGSPRVLSVQNCKMNDPR